MLLRDLNKFLFMLNYITKPTKRFCNKKHRESGRFGTPETFPILYCSI